MNLRTGLNNLVGHLALQGFYQELKFREGLLNLFSGMLGKLQGEQQRALPTIKKSVFLQSPSTKVIDPKERAFLSIITQSYGEKRSLFGGIFRGVARNN